jgi:hypothetical protein
MSLLKTHRLNLSDARREVSDLSKFMKERDFFSESEIVSQFKLCPNVTVLAGTLCRGMIVADAFKYEFKIAGVVAADLALRSKSGERAVFVEFESGERNSIFGTKATNQLQDWARSIEHATSQIVDWSWVLADAGNSAILKSNLGIHSVDVQYLVVCGRDKSIPSDIMRNRFNYRHSRLSIAGNSVVFLTYDGFVKEIDHALSELRTEESGSGI